MVELEAHEVDLFWKCVQALTDAVRSRLFERVVYYSPFAADRPMSSGWSSPVFTLAKNWCHYRHHFRAVENEYAVALSTLRRVSLLAPGSWHQVPGVVRGLAAKAAHAAQRPAQNQYFKISIKTRP